MGDELGPSHASGQEGTGRLRRPLRNIARALSSPVRVPLELYTSTRITRLTGFVPIAKTDPDDVFIVGYPKSGNTWFQNLVCAILYGIQPEYTPERVIADLVPDVHYERYYRRYYEPTFFKSHHLPRPEYRRVVYLVRDGRDATVSYYNHIQAVEHSRLDLLTMVKTGRDLFPSKWHDHVDAWTATPTTVRRS